MSNIIIMNIKIINNIKNIIKKNIKINIEDIIQAKYIYLLLLILIFFLFGLILSELIDYIFPELDDKNEDHRIIIEIIGEIGIAYLIYYSLSKYIHHFINVLYQSIYKKPPYYLYQILLIAFSSGVYKHLKKSSNKVEHIKNKYIEHYKKIISTKNY
jgi:hypothetical protein